MTGEALFPLFGKGALTILENIFQTRSNGKLILRPERSVDGMLCMECGANADKGYTTDVTDLGGKP